MNLLVLMLVFCWPVSALSLLAQTVTTADRSSGIAGKAGAAASARSDGMYGKVVSPTLIEGVPYFIHGKAFSLIETDKLHGFAVVESVNEHLGYEEVLVSFRNMQDHLVTIDPLRQITANGKPSCDNCTSPSEPPLNEKDVALIAKKIMRKQMFGIMAAGVVGNAVASQYSQFSPTNTYEVSRNDELTDASAQKSLEQSKGFSQNQFLTTTLSSKQLVMGKLYFNIRPAKKNESGGFVPQYADVSIEGINYRFRLD